MKIICIGRNYVAHAAELGNDVPDQPMVFMKPPTALLIDNQPLYYPDFTKDIHYEGELVLKIAKNGRHIQSAFANDYIDSIGFGIDFTARDLQQYCKENGYPWEIAKAWDHSAAISNDWIPYSEFKGQPSIRFEFHQNGIKVQDGDTSLMIFSFTDIITFVSRFFRLNKGDLIFTGTPAGVGPIAKGDKLNGFIEGRAMLECEIK